MLKTAALIFGIILLIVGILGFIPQATPGGMLFGVFHVNDVHNWIHILTGIVGILCGINSERASRLFFQIFGIIYGIVAILGFFYGSYPILGVVANNLADAILHVAIAAVSLYLGFGCGCCKCDKKHIHHDSDINPPRDQNL